MIFAKSYQLKVFYCIQICTQAVVKVVKDIEYYTIDFDAVDHRSVWYEE